MPARPSAFAALAFAASLAAAAPERVERRLVAMGTGLAVSVEAPERRAALVASEAAVRAVEAVEQRLSTWRADSEFATVNAAAADVAVPVSEPTASELARALELAAATEGAFDPTIGALVRAWDLRGAGRVPDEVSLAAALASTGHRFVRVEDGAVVRARGDVVIEEGGFGKGAGLDAAASALRAAGVRAGRVDLGGQVLWFGDEARSLVLAHPRERDVAVLELTAPKGAVSAATSSNSEHARVVDGERVGHLLDPRTGRPASDFGSVTVFAPTALDADALSTGLFVMGPEAALAFAEARDGVDAIVLEPDAARVRVRHTSGLDDRVAPAAGWRVAEEGQRSFVLVPTDGAAHSPRDSHP